MLTEQLTSASDSPVAIQDAVDRIEPDGRSGRGPTTAGDRARGAQRDRMGVVTRAVDAGIGWYHRRLSPRKGWACAHRVAAGGPSCPAAVRASYFGGR